MAAVRALPDKHWMSDPLPTKLMKDNVAPFLVELFHRSLAVDIVLSIFKSAYITPLLKKAELDRVDVHVKSYCPISNLLQASAIARTFGTVL